MCPNAIRKRPDTAAPPRGATPKRVGVTRRSSDRAADAAYTAQREFQEKLLSAGRRALETLDLSSYCNY